MLLRAALPHLPCKPIEALTDLKPMLPDQVVSLAEVFRALARVAWHWLQRRASQCLAISNNAGLVRGLRHEVCAFASAALLRRVSTKSYCRKGLAAQRRGVLDVSAAVQEASASPAHALHDMQRQDAACLWLRGPPCSANAPRGSGPSVFRVERLPRACYCARCFGAAALASRKRSSAS
jgi:hypothetical protein